MEKIGSMTSNLISLYNAGKVCDIYEIDWDLTQWILRYLNTIYQFVFLLLFEFLFMNGPTCKT